MTENNKLRPFNVTFMFPQHEIESGKWETARCKITAKDGDYTERYFNKDNPPYTDTGTAPQDTQEKLNLAVEALEALVEKCRQRHPSESIQEVLPIAKQTLRQIKGE